MRFKLDGRYVLIVTLILATVGVAIAGYVAQGYQYDHLFGLYQKQNQQLRDNGINPATPTPAQVAKDGAVGAQGDKGDRGPGPTDAQVLYGIQQYCSVQNCRGETGATGAAGAPGSPGANGDSITGPQGPKGDPGDPGESITGPAGTNGANGQPPFSWTYTDKLGGSHTCTRTDPFDPAQPTYQCN